MNFCFPENVSQNSNHPKSYTPEITSVDILVDRHSHFSLSIYMDIHNFFFNKPVSVAQKCILGYSHSDAEKTILNLCYESLAVH